MRHYLVFNIGESAALYVLFRFEIWDGYVYDIRQLVQHQSLLVLQMVDLRSDKNLLVGDA